MNAQTSIVAGDAVDLSWIIAAHEAGRNDPDPFFQPEGNEQ